MAGVFLRAVITGFGFSLGAALYKRISTHFGLDEPKKDEKDKSEEPPTPPGAVVGATSPARS